MPYIGEIKQAITYTIHVDNGGVGAGMTAITILKIDKRDQIASAETELVDAGTRVSFSGATTSRNDRLIIQVHPPRHATAHVQVIQGLSSFTESCDCDTDLVFSTVP